MVDFYAPWCKACVVFEPKYKCVVNEAKRQGMDLVFAKVDTDQSPYLKQYFGINTFPRLLLFSKSGGPPRRYNKMSHVYSDQSLRSHIQFQNC